MVLLQNRGLVHVAVVSILFCILLKIYYNYDNESNIGLVPLYFEKGW